MWRRDPRIINLYDKPLYCRRRPVWREARALGLGSALLSCAAITLATAAFFWTYDAIVHRDAAYVPALAQEASITSSSPRPSLDVPVPDMKSAEVVRANADVLLSKAEAQVSQPPAVERKAAETPPKKKKVQTAIRLPREAGRAYASAPTFFQSPPFGGW